MRSCAVILGLALSAATSVFAQGPSSDEERLNLLIRLQYFAVNCRPVSKAIDSLVATLWHHTDANVVTNGMHRIDRQIEESGNGKDNAEPINQVARLGWCITAEQKLRTWK